MNWTLSEREGKRRKCRIAISRPCWAPAPTSSTGWACAKQYYPEHLPRIRFKDPESGRTLVFLTNNTGLPALTICALDKSRWQVELFFKWIKQRLRIKQFLGTSENAVKTQIWCAIAKKSPQLDASLYTLLQILSVSVFEKIPLKQAFAGNDYVLEQISTDTQPNGVC